MPYIILIRYRCDITVVNTHAPTEHNNKDAWNSFHAEPENVFNQFLTYHIKIVRENIFYASGIESLNKINNDKGVRVANMALLTLHWRGLPSSPATALTLSSNQAAKEVSLPSPESCEDSNQPTPCEI
jgi:hypothetical protein